MQESPGPAPHDPAPHDPAERAAAVPPPPAAPPPDSPPLETLKKRAEFLACARGRSAHTPGMVVQSRRRKADGEGGSQGGNQRIRVGFTASRKVGNAVIRNRARRRLREVAREVLPRRGRQGCDYVLIARNESTVSRPFTKLIGDLEQALDRLHGKGKA